MLCVLPFFYGCGGKGNRNKMAANVLLFVFLGLYPACFISLLVVADRVPVLMWSTDRPFSDLPASSDNISQDTFHADYLKPLVDSTTPVLVVFLQDKLHLTDISKYGDVYNSESDGGAFANIKGLLDRHFSLELPYVENSHKALHSVRQNFPGDVHSVSHISDLSDLDLSPKAVSLVMVSLQPVADAPNQEAAIAANDKTIGKITQHLENHDIKYTAVYTAEMSHSKQQEQRDARRGQRQLLAAETPGKNHPAGAEDEGKFFNVSSPNGTLYAYLRSISACVRPAMDPDKPPLDHCPFNFTLSNLNGSHMSAVPAGNRTVNLTLTIPKIEPKNSTNIYNFKLIMPFQHQLDRWEILEAAVTIGNLSGHTVARNFRLVTHGYDTMVPVLYSFHCTSMEWYPWNMSAPTLVYIVLGGFQVQPFHTHHFGFLPAQDCVGWFSAPIWMGLVVGGIHVAILIFGLAMLASLTTNDRFDDPKGKALTFNAQE